MNEKMLFFQVILLSVAVTLGAKNPDEDHPYEFGFTIDGQQHRHEKKDDKGIIQGEFGFITADGIYHVTVYATDENGNFKILSMRNLRISAPLDGSPFKGEISPDANKYRKQANLAPLPEPNPLALPANSGLPIQSSVQPELGSTTERVKKFTTQSTIRPACASCGLISTPKPQPVQPFLYQNTANGQGTPVNQPTSGGALNVQNPHQTVGSGTPNSANLPQYQAVSGPQSTSYNIFGSQNSQSSGGGVLTGGNPGFNGNGYVNVENKPQAPGSELGNTDGQFSNVGGSPYNSNSCAGDYNKPGQTPVNVENAPGSPVSFSQLGNTGQRGQNPNAPPGADELNNDNVQEPNVEPIQVNIEQSGHIDSVNQQGNIQSGTGFFATGQSGAPEPNPLELPSGQGANSLSTLPPITVSDGFIHVGGDRKQDIPIKDKFPGMEDGLPAGIEEKDISNLLYKFHYTVGFHGHYEKGLKNGAKIGGYFVNGRDGISRVVTYIADENGYRPKVKFINLGLESDDTPKPETEKTFGLKSFEFVWYPL